MATVRFLGLFPWGCPQSYPPRSLVNGEIETFATGPGSFFPIQMPLSQAVAFFWRVKRWKVSFTYSFYRTTDTGYQQIDATEISYITAPNTNNPQNAIAPFLRSNNERDLVCSGDLGDPETGRLSFQWQEQLTGTAVSNGVSSTFNRTLTTRWGNLEMQEGMPTPFVYTQAASVVVNGRMFGDSVWAGFEIDINTVGSLQRSFSEVGSGILSLLGKEYTFPLFGGTEDSVTDLVIEPHEHWPYNPGDDKGPIYNTAGKQIRGFPTN